MSDSGNLDSGQPADDDPGSDFDEWGDWLDREIAAGRDPIPPERAFPEQGIGVSLGDAAEIDPGLLAAVCGADGLSNEGTGSLSGERADSPGDEQAGSLGGTRPASGFAQGAAADVLPPGPVLAALTEAAVTDVARLSDDQLIGVLQAAQRQANREGWKKALVIAEFARRREAEFRAAAVSGVPVHCRPGQYPGEELAMELLLGPVQASHAIDDSADLTTRLPATLAAMAAGLVDEARAGVIAMYTRSLSLADAALADGILAAAAPDLRLDQLIGKAAKLEMRLAPEAAQARKAHARRTRRRVEVRREESGNACVAGREMDTGDALAAKAHIHGLALRLRRAGTPGSLDQLRLLVFTDLTAGRDPLDRLARPGGQDTGPGAPAGLGARTPGAGAGSGAVSRSHGGGPPPPEGPVGEGSSGGGSADRVGADERGARSAGGSGAAGSGAAGSGAAGSGAAGSGAAGSGAADDSRPTGTRLAGDAGPADTWPSGGGRSLDYDDDDYGDDAGSAVPAPRAAAPVPALINLVVPAGTLFGWDTTPSEADGWGLLDAGETQAIVTAAARHPATRWCVTITGPGGTATAHGCSSGQHPWAPANQDKPPPDRRKPAPGPAQGARLAEFLRGLNLTLQTVASGGCDHAAAEPRYTPSRKLAHLVQARTMTCDAPGCAAQAVYADLDHTIPYPVGPTDQCNLGPKCRRHHKAKQAPGWKVEQAEPGVIRWTLPSGRTHTTRPTVYDPLLAGR